MSRGADGLTKEELRKSRAFWDDRYTRELLEAIPSAAGTLVDIGCGLARAAHELLPHRPELRYLGVDIDGARLADAAREVAASAFASRARLLRAAGEHLPLSDGITDAVLAAMTLQHVADPNAILREARRVLAPGGVMVGVEPDYTGQRFYFDGPLDEITAALNDLRAACQEAKRPADHNIGPRVPRLLRDAGFREVTSRVHALQFSSHETAAQVATQFLQMTDILAATAGPPGEAPAEACRAAVTRWLAEIGAQTTGLQSGFVPVFVTRGER